MELDIENIWVWVNRCMDTFLNGLTGVQDVVELIERGSR
jgi:hypothetical protein